MRYKTSLQIKVLLAVLICASISFPQARPIQQRAPQSRPGAPFLQQAKAYEESAYITKIVLKNGMTVLVNEFRIQPVVSLQLYVHTGMFDDPAQMPGTARLVAALAQRGAADKSGGTYRQNVQALGGILRSATGYEATMFEIVAPSNQWKRALNAQADAILNPSLNPDAIKLESKLLLGEARAALDDPGESAREQLLQLAFNQPRMGINDAIKDSAFGKSSVEALTPFYKINYSPDNMMLVVSGDVGASEVLNEVARIYAKLSGAAAKPATFPFSASQDGFQYRGVTGEVSTPHVWVGFHTVSDKDTDYAALEVLRAVLGMGESAVIPLRLRDQKKLILSFDVQLTASPQFGYLSIRMNTKPADIDRSELALWTELELLKREDLTDAEVERALAQLERSYWPGQETVSGRAQRIARFESAGDWKQWDRYLSDLRKVKAADVRRVASKYLRLENCALLEYLPGSMADRKLNAEAFRNTFDALLKSAADQEAAERAKKIVLAVKFPVATGFKFSEIQFPLQTASILRGPNLFIKEEHTSPLIEMGLFYPGGRLDEKKENAGITELMTRVMLRGAADVSQTYLQFEIYGGQVKPVLTDDYFGIYLSVPSPNFEDAFKLISEMIRTPAFEKDEVQRQKEIQTAEILASKNSDPLSLLNQSLFRGFAYGLDRHGTEESIAAVTPEALAAWHETHVKNRKPVVVLIGDTKGTSLASLFVQSFSGSRMQEVKIPEQFAKALEKGESPEQDWSRSEGLILVGFQAPPEDDEDKYAVSVLQSYIGDPGRLSQELRDRLGVSFEVSADYVPRLRGGSFVITAATTPDSEADALKALRSEVQRANADPIPSRDFRSAVNEALGTYAIEQQARFAQIAGITEEVLAGRGIDGYQNYSAGLQEVKEEDLKPIISRILNMDHAVILRLKGKSK